MIKGDIAHYSLNQVRSFNRDDPSLFRRAKLDFFRGGEIFEAFQGGRFEEVRHSGEANLTQKD